MMLNDCETFLPGIPFENIALTFSGGGFRAASFSLGVLSYLNHCYLKNEDDKLINHVKFITSTSGGSITNALFATTAYSQPDYNFQDFYNRLRDSMHGEALLAKVFEILKDDAQWTEYGVLTNNGENINIKKPRNLINAFAKAYDQLLFKGKTLDCIYNCEHKPHLEEVCFNSTEFNNGLSFYFQVNCKNDEPQQLGNGYLRLSDPEVIRHLKLSDIVAASSCFPGGFEPIIYPNDFVHADLMDINKMFAAVKYKHNNPLDLLAITNQPFSLMDGGIADNMGIVNVMNEDQSRLEDKNQHRFDLIMACDVTSYFNEPVAQPAETKSKGISIQSIINIFKYSLVFVLISAALMIFNVLPVIGYLLIIPSLSLTIIYTICRFKLTRLESSEKGKVAKMMLKYLNYFLRLPSGVLLPMMRSRADSGVKLISDLFLKQIRRGQYENLFTKPRMVHRTISCLIYEFSAQHADRRVSILKQKDKLWWDNVSAVLMPSAKLQQTANKAKAVGTTLWFDESELIKEQRDKVIATGQFTACYNLIKHICRLEVLDPKYKDDGALQGLKRRLFEDWEKFQLDPVCMV